MADHVEFNEPKISTASFAEGGRVGLEGRAVGFVRNLLGGLIKNDNQAKSIIIIFVLILLLVSVYYFLQSAGPSGTKEVLKSINA